ncbi:serine hydrolase-domain-containing protein [Xylariomycetidae sp. FL0641]|nr:serine hydrolase-domain-containing protein [Xylariomycetidae sp. FL0641]
MTRLIRRMCLADTAAVTDEYYGWLGAGFDAAQVRDLLADLGDLVASQGPFDSVMGFSEGGIVAAMLLLHAGGGFRCAVFLSAALPLDPASAQEGSTALRCAVPSRGPLVTVPTAHIAEAAEVADERLRERSPMDALWVEAGYRDLKQLREALARLCQGDLREEFVHDLGHEVPGARLSKGLDGAVRAIERTIDRANALEL